MTTKIHSAKTKQELRKQIKSLLSEKIAFLEEYSAQVCNNIERNEHFFNSDVILGYMALKDEVNITPILEKTIKSGKKVYIPKVDPDSPQMDFFEYSVNANISAGAFGIDEPDGLGKPFDLASCNKKIIVLVPGRLFTKDGKRLGRGKGYYDVFLEKLFKYNPKNTVAVGVCFDMQLAEDLPCESHDILMNTVISQNGGCQ